MHNQLNLRPCIKVFQKKSVIHKNQIKDKIVLTPEEWMALWISLKVACTATVLSLPFAILIGYFLARSETRFKSLFETIIYIPLVLPPIVTGYLLLLLFSKNYGMGEILKSIIGIQIPFTWLGAVVAAAVVSFPLVVRSVRSAFQNVDPRLEAAARSLGAGWWDQFFSISLPLAMRGIVAGAILGFARSLGEFGATIILAGNIANQTQTIPLAIYSLTQRPRGIEQSWRLVVISIILACLALFISEWLERKEEKRVSA